MPIRANALVVMVKAPTPGRVKTRLMPFLSAAQAAALARALLLDQLKHLRALRNTDLYLAFTPASARPSMRRMAPARFSLFPQRGKDLGARMHHSFATLFAKDYKCIVLIGADLPPLPVRYFTQAFIYLDGKKSPVHPPLANHVLSGVEGRGGFDEPQPRVVLGPSHDGGYYLIGLNRAMPEIFAKMRWSHDRVFAQTLTRLRTLSVPTFALPEWFDVDTIKDLKRLLLLRGAPHKAMRHTLSLLRRLPILKSTNRRKSAARKHLRIH